MQYFLSCIFFGHYNINKGLTYKEKQCLIYKPSARLCNSNCHTAKKMVGKWWFGFVLQPQHMDTLQSLRWPWISVCAYIYILEINVRLSVWQPKFASCNTRLISSIAANLQKNGLRCCNGPALTDMLWWVRKRAVRKWIPTNLNELTQIPPQWCERLVITQKTITSIYCC